LPFQNRKFTLRRGECPSHSLISYIFRCGFFIQKIERNGSVYDLGRVRGCNDLLELSLELVPEGDSILSELLDALVKLVERHLILKEFPTKFGLVVNIGDLGNGVGLGGCGRIVRTSSVCSPDLNALTGSCVQLGRDWVVRALELLEEVRRDG
jgi:hypothetical protein